MGSGKHIQGEEKGGLQLGVHETQSLFLYCYLLIIVLFSVGTTLNLLLPRTTQLDHCGTGPQQGSLQKTGTKHPGAFACVCTHAHAHAEAACWQAACLPGTQEKVALCSFQEKHHWVGLCCLPLWVETTHIQWRSRVWKKNLSQKQALILHVSSLGSFW